MSVIVYHRIGEPSRQEFFGDERNISASPNDFAEQLDYLGREFDVISLADLEQSIAGTTRLPPRAVLITFDDGYRDNYTIAAPELIKRRMPAVLFVATGFVGDQRAFVCDRAAEMLRRTRLKSATLPLIGLQRLDNAAVRRQATRVWTDAIKKILAADVEVVLRRLAEALNVANVNAPPHGTHVSWDELRWLQQNGIAIGAHTVTHSILSRVPLEVARQEIETSRREIEANVGQPVAAFAFPNGGVSDFAASHEALLGDCGINLGFSGWGGITSLKEIRGRPTAIRRTMINGRDDLSRFAIKASGLARFKEF